MDENEITFEATEQIVTFHIADQRAWRFRLSIEDVATLLEAYHSDTPTLQATVGNVMYHFKNSLVFCIEVEDAEDANTVELMPEQGMSKFWYWLKRQTEWINW